MTYQYIHLEGYSQRAPAKGDGKLTMQLVAAECERTVGNCPHVVHPREPVVLLGVSPSQIVADAEENLRRGKSPHLNGYRKPRRDAKAVMVGIASHPYTMAEIREDKDKADQYYRWEYDTQAWLVNQFGERLKSIVRHEDERRGHVHFWVLDGLERTDDGTEVFHGIHRIQPGLAAKARAKSEGLSAKEQNIAYCEALRSFQDSYFQDVAMKHGLLRLGPKRQRLTRGEWHAQVAQAEARRKLAQDCRRELDERIESYSAAAAIEREAFELRDEAFVELQGAKAVAEYLKKPDALDPATPLPELSREFTTDALWILSRLKKRVAEQFTNIWVRLRQQEKMVEEREKLADQKMKAATSMVKSLAAFMSGKLYRAKGAKKTWHTHAPNDLELTEHLNASLRAFPSEFAALNDNYLKAIERGVQSEKERLAEMEQCRAHELQQIAEMKQLLKAGNQIVRRYMPENISPQMEEDLEQLRQIDQLSDQFAGDQER